MCSKSVASPQGDCQEHAGDGLAEFSTGRLMLVCGPAYMIFALGVWATWDLGSAPAVLGVAFLATALAALMCGGFSIITARGAGMMFKARKRKQSKKARKTKSGAKRKVRLIETPSAPSTPAA